MKASLNHIVGVNYMVCPPQKRGSARDAIPEQIRNNWLLT